MEGLIILLVLFFLFGPITVAIVALVKANQVQSELKCFRREVHDALRREAAEARPKPPPAAETAVPPLPEPARPSPDPAPVQPEAKSPVTPAGPLPPRPAMTVDRKPRGGMEFLMGGKAAAFAGIAVLVTGIVFLVGYAIQNNWVGPGTRIVLGLLCGGALVGTGHFVQRRDQKLVLLARVLTGGGSALFYFSVFAAYGIYHLIGAAGAGLGLFASALAVFGLALAYRAQSVGVLGVLGAFITPLLIGGDFEKGVFPLVYVAVINVPVLLLGVRRKWQLLYNLSFAFTIIYFVLWLDWISSREVWIGMAFAILYYTEYAALGLLKLRSEQKVAGRTADMVRLILSSLLLLAAVYGLLDRAGRSHWVGAAFLILALYQVGLARFAFKVLSRFNLEILCFLAGGLIFATLALPAQLDGEWVSLGWAVEGAVLAWFAGRVKSRALQVGAFLLGLIGILKVLAFDLSLYQVSPRLFLNAHFAVGMLSAVLLGVQGWLGGRFPGEETTPWQDLLWCSGVVGMVLVFFTDTFWTLGSDEVSSWLITSLMLLATGTSVLLLAPRGSAVIRLGALLVLLVPLKLGIDALVGMEIARSSAAPFLNVVIWLQMAMVGMMILFLQSRIPRAARDIHSNGATLSRTLNIAALASGIAVMTLEILHSRSDWAATAVTILWAVCALTLILFGMKRRIAAQRYFGLILFGFATFKVLFVDASELNGLERIAAFIGTGLLLLVLSFAYQKASAYFQSLEEDQ